MAYAYKKGLKTIVKKLRILILEDSPERAKWFNINFHKEDNDIFISDDTKVVIEKLKNEKWDMLCLDHDLGDEILVESGENTGYEVAEWLSTQESHPDIIILHSLNPAGVQNMQDKLPKAIQFPFIWQQKLEDVINER